MGGGEGRVRGSKEGGGCKQVSGGAASSGAAPHRGWRHGRCTHILQELPWLLGDHVVQLLTKVLEVLQVNLQVVAPLLGIVEQALTVDEHCANPKVADELLGLLLHV